MVVLVARRHFSLLVLGLGMPRPAKKVVRTCTSLRSSDLSSCPIIDYSLAGSPFKHNNNARLPGTL